MSENELVDWVQVRWNALVYSGTIVMRVSHFEETIPPTTGQVKERAFGLPIKFEKIVFQLYLH